MTRKIWSTADVSAYLDGELKPETQIAFDAAITQDPDLQRRVAEMRQVVALLRSVPLQEPPRNYLLTQTMVSESKPRSKRPRLPLLMMRVATSVAAAAFAVTSALTLMQRGITPAMMTQSRELPNAAVMLERESDDDSTEVLEAPMAQAVPVEEVTASEAPAAPPVEKAAEVEVEVAEAVAAEAPLLPTPSAQATPSIEELSVSDEQGVSTPEYGIGGGGEVLTPELGIGGGGEVLTLAGGMGGGLEIPTPELGIGGGEAIEPEADSIAATVEETEPPGLAAAIVEPDVTELPSQETAQAEEETAPAEMAAAAEVAEGEPLAMELPLPPGEAAEEMLTLEGSEAAARMMIQEDETTDTVGESIEAAEVTSKDTPVAPALWAPVGLGIVTAALAGITFWMSRRQLD